MPASIILCVTVVKMIASIYAHQEEAIASSLYLARRERANQMVSIIVKRWWWFMWIVQYIRLHTHTHTPEIDNTRSQFFGWRMKGKNSQPNEKSWFFHVLFSTARKNSVVLLFDVSVVVFFYHFVSRPIRESILRFGPWFHCYFAWHFISVCFFFFSLDSLIEMFFAIHTHTRIIFDLDVGHG